MLFPRHARWTLLMLDICLSWFFCAMIYNNTKTPLDIPEFTKEAKNLAFEDLWISLMTPIGNMIIIYLFASLFKISEERIKYAADLNTLKEML